MLLKLEQAAGLAAENRALKTRIEEAHAVAERRLEEAHAAAATERAASQARVDEKDKRIEQLMNKLLG